MRVRLKSANILQILAPDAENFYKFTSSKTKNKFFIQNEIVNKLKLSIY